MTNWYEFLTSLAILLSLLFLAMIAWREWVKYLRKEMENQNDTTNL